MRQVVRHVWYIASAVIDNNGELKGALIAGGPLAVKQTDPQLAKIDAAFKSSFGSTPLEERVADILAQATSIDRFRDMAHLKQETGDLLCSVLQLCNECDWIPAELIAATLLKIDSRREIYEKLGRKLRVGLLGGAFDPIHVSHIQLARDVLDSGVVDEVWLMPCFEHLAGKSMAAANLRLEMCEIACRGVRGVRVFDYEIRHQFRGESYHLVKKLLADVATESSVEYRLIVGQDNADAFQTWTNAVGLERLIPFVVVPRKGCDNPKPNSWYLRAPHRFIEPAVKHRQTSSSEVRSLLQKRDERVNELLPVGVLEFIREHQLYLPAPVSSPNRRIAVYANSFDPPGNAHRQQVQALLNSGFDEVIVFPTGARAERGEHQHAAPIHRAALVSLAFRDLERVTVDYSDISLSKSSTPLDLDSKYASRGEVWHVVPPTLVENTDGSGTPFESQWGDDNILWRDLRFAILHDVGRQPELRCQPQQYQFIEAPDYPNSSELRARVYRGESIADYVDPNVADYVNRHRLFIPNAGSRQAVFRIHRPRLLIVSDERNPKSLAVAQQYSKFASSSPNLILVLGGDGTMLRAIREHWKLRVPFVGLNTGHLGFLMNEQLPLELERLELVSYMLPMLRVDALTSDGERSWGLAYSDVWLERAEGQAAWLRVHIDGETRVSRIVGDGMLVATASGSSAYARAMGGVPIPIDTPTLSLAGSNIFQPRFWKPMVLSEDRVITISSLDYTGKRPVRGFIDGSPLGIVQEISVRRSLTASVELAFTKEFDPSTRLLRSLFPPEG